MAGTIKAFAIGTAERNPALPNVPTVIESGLPAFQVTSWYGLAAPAGTPKPAIDRLNAETNKALQSAEVVAQSVSRSSRSARRYVRRTGVKE